MWHMMICLSTNNFIHFTIFAFDSVSHGFGVCYAKDLLIDVSANCDQYLSIRTTVTPSFSSDSPNTIMKRTSLTWTCSNTAMTATGSTAAIRLPKRRYCSRPMSRSPTAHQAQETLVLISLHCHYTCNNNPGLAWFKLLINKWSQFI